MTPVDWTATYLAHLPVRSEGGAGTCTDCAVVYAMELVAILTGQPVVQLSQLFLQWQQNPYPGQAQGGSGVYGLAKARDIGVCAEALWPITLAYGPDTARTGVTDYNQIVLALNTPPSPACYTDAPNYRVTDFEPLYTTFTRDQKIAVCQNAIAAGFPVVFYLPGRNHELCAFGFDAGGVITLDPMSSYTIPGHCDWDTFEPNAVVRSVRFVQGGPYTFPSPSGNAAIIAALRAALDQWRPGMVTQAKIDEGKAWINSLVADSATPPITPAGGAAWSVPPDASGTDAQGHVWSLGNTTPAGKQVLRDGQQFAGGQATLIDYHNGTIKVQNNAGAWYTPSGNGWAGTTAP